MVIYDPDPNPKNEEQAIARSHRIGQTKEVGVDLGREGGEEERRGEREMEREGEERAQERGGEGGGERRRGTGARAQGLSG